MENFIPNSPKVVPCFNSPRYINYVMFFTLEKIINGRCNNTQAE